MNWAPRIRVAKIRRLYRSARLGAPDETMLHDVGLGLYQRAEDVVAVVTALQLGEVPCPDCDAPVQRRGMPSPTDDMRRDLLTTHHRVAWFHCEACQERLLWQDCRKALRETPRCFDCGQLLAGSDGMLACSCGSSWSLAAYSASVGRRKRLPCPRCQHTLSRPTLQNEDITRSAEPASTAEYLCSKCADPMVRSGPRLACGSCGHSVQWRSYRKALKRRGEILQCSSCGLEFSWRAWRKKVADYGTQTPGPAYDFVSRWDAGGSPQQLMMHIDVLIQSLHGQGALGPVFVEGTKESVRQLLDELAARS